jgi:putative ABC transport system substrate-binding protein
MSKRVNFIALTSLLFGLWSSAEAQQTKNVPRIGVLAAPSASFFATRINAFQEGLRSHGYIDGKNIVIEYRYAEGKLDRLPALAAELVRLKVDVIVTSATAGALALKNATGTIPVIFVATVDPVVAGLVASLARPGGNITGLTNVAPDLSGKRLELLKESFPRVTRVAFLWNPSGPTGPLLWKETLVAAPALALELYSLEVRTPGDFDSAFDAAGKSAIHALIVQPDPLINTHQRRILDFAVKNRLPAIYAGPEFVDAGGLMSYAPSYTEQYRRAATYVDKILKGTKPAELPVEQPTRFELIINLKTAKEIGLTVPPNVLARADKVIR